MAINKATRVRTSLRLALQDAGLSAETGAASFRVDLSGLDESRLVPKRQEALRIVASLLLRLDQNVDVTAKLPTQPRGRRALAASGVMFALAEHEAIFETEESTASGPESLFPLRAVDRLASIESWRDTYTPFDYELRDRMLHGGQASPRPGLGIYDSDFAAFVNPHRLPAGSELAAIARVANPWLARLIAADRDDASSVTDAAMEVIGHALDNIREHAFTDLVQARSLVTMGRVVAGDRAMYRIQVLDTGVGIPASLAPQIDHALAATEALSKVVHGSADGYDPLLPMGRNLGLPRIRQLAGEVDGVLGIDTAGPDETVVRIRCHGSRPSEPWSDKIPVSGTIITLAVPVEPQSDENRDDDQQAFDL